MTEPILTTIPKEVTHPESAELQPKPEVLAAMEQLALNRPTDPDSHTATVRKLQQSTDAKRSELVGHILNALGMRNMTIREVSGKWHTAVIDIPEVTNEVAILADMVNYVAQTDSHGVHGFIDTAARYFENDLIFTLRDTITEQIRVEADSTQQPHLQKVLDIIEKIQNKETGLTGILQAHFLKKCIYKDDELVSVEDFVKNLTEILTRRGQRLTELKAQKDQFQPVYGYASHFVNKVLPDYRITSTEKMLKQTLDDELLSHLMVLEHIHDNPGATIDDALADSTICQRLEQLNALAAEQTVVWGCELESKMELDDTSIESLVKSFRFGYASIKERRHGLQNLLHLGIPVDEDGLGEICIPRSLGYQAQLEAWRIVTKLGLSPKEAAVHISVSGIEQPVQYIDDLLLISLAFTADDHFGMISATDADSIQLGFPESSQKPIVRERGLNGYGPKGLPVLIEGNRIEFRGIVNSELFSYEDAEKALPVFSKVIEALAAYSRGEESNWPKLKQLLLSHLAQDAFPQIDQIKAMFYNPLEAYLHALKMYSISKLPASLIGEDKQKVEKARQAALADPTFIDYLSGFYTGDELSELMADTNRLQTEIEYYYQENKQFSVQIGDKQQLVFTKTWESMRGNIALRALRDPEFRIATQSILTVAK